MDAIADDSLLTQSSYQHDIHVTEEIGRRIGILLARGNFEGAFQSLRYAIENELTTIPVKLSEMSLSELGNNDDGVWKQTVNQIERSLGVVFIEQLRGVDLETIEAIPNIGERRIKMLAQKLRKAGLPFPIPEHFELPDEPAFDFSTFRIPAQQAAPPQERMMVDTTRTLVDAICNADESDIEKIDAEIKRLEAMIGKLKQAKKVLGKATKPKAKTNGVAHDGVSPSAMVREYIEKYGESHRDDVLRDLGMTGQGLSAVIRHSDELGIDADGMVCLG